MHPSLAIEFRNRRNTDESITHDVDKNTPLDRSIDYHSHYMDVHFSSI